MKAPLHLPSVLLFSHPGKNLLSKHSFHSASLKFGNVASYNIHSGGARASTSIQFCLGATLRVLKLRRAGSILWCVKFGMFDVCMESIGEVSGADERNGVEVVAGGVYEMRPRSIGFRHGLREACIAYVSHAPKSNVAEFTHTSLSIVRRRLERHETVRSVDRSSSLRISATSSTGKVSRVCITG